MPPFEQFKRDIIRLAKRQNKGHMVPGSDTMYTLWEQKLSVEEVVATHCTLEAQKKRHTFPA